jgi:hypothetical protein
MYRYLDYQQYTSNIDNRHKGKANARHKWNIALTGCGSGTSFSYASKASAGLEGHIIILYVRWYTRFQMRLRDLMIMMTDRGITLSDTTILRWVQHTCQNSRSVGADMLVWWADPGGGTVRSRWAYWYGAPDKAGQTVDFFLGRRRDLNTVKTLRKCEEQPAHAHKSHLGRLRRRSIAPRGKCRFANFRQSESTIELIA